jgi:hypothetical protein
VAKRQRRRDAFFPTDEGGDRNVVKYLAIPCKLSEVSASGEVREALAAEMHAPKTPNPTSPERPRQLHVAIVSAFPFGARR